MTLTEKLPKVRQYLLDHIAFCETKVTAEPWHVANGVPDAVVLFPGGAIHGKNLICEAKENNATFIALSRILDPIMAKGWVLTIDWADKQHRDTVAKTKTGMHRCHNVFYCPACVFLQSLLDLIPDEMLTRI